MSLADFGLLLFVLVIFIDVVLLLFDLVLYLSGVSTITRRVKFNFSLGLIIVVLQVVGLTGLLLHFYW